jgi:hypothetical protein
MTNEDEPETFLIRTSGGPIPGTSEARGTTWPLPDVLPYPGGEYRKTGESLLPPDLPHVLRGAIYTWHPDDQETPDA